MTSVYKKIYLHDKTDNNTLCGRELFSGVNYSEDLKEVTCKQCIKEYAINNIAGTKINNWEVIARVESDKNQRKVFLCKCSCGELEKVRADHLLNGTRRACLKCKPKREKGTSLYVPGTGGDMASYTTKCPKCEKIFKSKNEAKRQYCSNCSLTVKSYAYNVAY